MKVCNIILFVLSFTSYQAVQAQNKTLLQPKWVFDGETLHENWEVIVQGNIILAAGEKGSLKEAKDAEIIALPGMTLMPGLIEGHSHIMLHPYDETNWNDQVLKESHAYRVARATRHVEASLMAGVTTMRDLGSEGAGYADVGVKKAIEDGVITGPRLLVAGPAIVATGSYGPKGFAPHVNVPLGAESADGYDELLRVVRKQIGGGADLVKVYADYRWGRFGEAKPTFSQEEIELIVATATSSGRQTVAHATTTEGMRRAALAGVRTIEHGDGGTPEVYDLMKQNNVALCPTLGAVHSIMQYRGWNPETDPDPARIAKKKVAFKQALETGVEMIFGGDVGVYDHGNNALELELMVEYGMPVTDVIKAATSGNARIFELEQLGKISEGYTADLIAVKGNPLTDIKLMRQVEMVMKDGEFYKK